jgi:hypothetical protein
MGRGLYETGVVSILDRWRRRVYERDLAGAANFLGVLKACYLFAAIGTGVWLWGVFGTPRTLDRVYGFCLLIIFMHGFLATTSRPVLWATIAAVAQTLYVLRVVAAGGVPVFGFLWMSLLWGGVQAAQQVERIVKNFPQLSAQARRLPWRMACFVILVFGVSFLLPLLAALWW